MAWYGMCLNLQTRLCHANVQRPAAVECIELLFRFEISVGPTNIVLDGGTDSMRPSTNYFESLF